MPNTFQHRPKFFARRRFAESAESDVQKPSQVIETPNPFGDDTLSAASSTIELDELDSVKSRVFHRPTRFHNVELRQPLSATAMAAEKMAARGLVMGGGKAQRSCGARAVSRR